MQVEIWSDVVCPWCFVGKRRFERALERFEHRDEVEVVWRSFELDAGAPRTHEAPYAERLAAKYGTSVGEARSMIARMVSAGAEEGVDLRFDTARAGNTFDAHRLLHLARVHGVQHEVAEALFRAAFTDGVAIGEPEQLVTVVTAAGLPEAAAQRVLDGDEFASAVREDEVEATRLGVTGVPFFVVDRRYAVGGAQSPDLLLEVLQRSWREREEPAA